MQAVSVHLKDRNDKFVQRTHAAMKHIDTEDQFLVFGYFRQTASSEYGLQIPEEIAAFCIAYLYLYTERLYIGNLHSRVQHTNPNARNTHKWTLFISASKQKLVKPSSIKYVKYFLHPTFRPNQVRISEAPFLLTRRGYGTFSVDVAITFKAKCRRQAIFTQHYLRFDRHASLTPVYEPESARKQESGIHYLTEQEYATNTV